MGTKVVLQKYADGTVVASLAKDVNANEVFVRVCGTYGSLEEAKAAWPDAELAVGEYDEFVKG